MTSYIANPQTLMGLAAIVVSLVGNRLVAWRMGRMNDRLDQIDPPVKLQEGKATYEVTGK